MPDIGAADINTERSEKSIKFNLIKETQMNMLRNSEIYKDETMISSIH